MILSSRAATQWLMIYSHICCESVQYNLLNAFSCKQQRTFSTYQFLKHINRETLVVGDHRSAVHNVNIQTGVHYWPQSTTAAACLAESPEKPPGHLPMLSASSCCHLLWPSEGREISRAAALVLWCTCAEWDLQLQKILISNVWEVRGCTVRYQFFAAATVISRAV